MSVYTFITQPYRWSEQANTAIRSSFRTARQVEIDGFLTNLADADSMSATLFNILANPRLFFEVPVVGVNVVTPSSFIGETPCALLTSDRFSLQTGRLVAVVSYSLDLNAGITTLQCWG